ncbi:hypothetical protein ISO18_04500 [Burkholderia pseudomultivorans]|nr:hypothetical protein [Burkholderia pseudomultivorans]MBF5008860.1 hypothetical protein [Burkholderia pseudomultivorans]
MKHRETLAALISALASVSALAQGVKPSEMTSGPQIQRFQQQQLEAVKELNPSPNVLTPTGEKPADTGIANLPLDTPCFPIQAVGRASGSYAGVNEQAGIQAGDGGFDIKVGGNTDLKGAYIASTATQDKNQLTTGTLTFSDIQNRSEHEASSVGISAGGGVGNGGNVGVNTIGGATTTALNNILHGKSDSVVGAGVGSGALSSLGYGIGKLGESWISSTIKPTINTSNWDSVNMWSSSGWNIFRPNTAGVIGGGVMGGMG